MLASTATSLIKLAEKLCNKVQEWLGGLMDARLRDNVMRERAIGGTPCLTAASLKLLRLQPQLCTDCSDCFCG